jgi:hypothetical protein
MRVWASRNGRYPRRLGLEPITEIALEHQVLRHVSVVDDDLGKRARVNREWTIETVLGIFGGHGVAGDTTGNSPGTKWTAFNPIAEHLDYGPLDRTAQPGPALLRGLGAQAARARDRDGGLARGGHRTLRRDGHPGFGSDAQASVDCLQDPLSARTRCGA